MESLILKKSKLNEKTSPENYILMFQRQKSGSIVNQGDEQMTPNKVRLMDGTDCTPAESVQWMNVMKKPVVVNALKMLMDFEVDTLEGTHRGNAGDYLMKGVDGELYPIKKEIFNRTYDIIKG